MSDLPISTQPNQPKKTLDMADFISPIASIASSAISGGCTVVASLINQQTQLKLADKSQETQLKLEQLKNELKKASELEQFDRQKQLQLELAEFTRETQLEIAAKQRETALALPEVNKIFENWPLRIFPSFILDSHIHNNRPPLKVIIAPPEVNFDKFGSATQGLPKMENTLAQGLRQFLDKNYHLNSQIRPVQLLDGAWDSNKYHGGSSIQALFKMLKSEPLLILESEIEGDYLNFRIAYWGYGQTIYRYETVLARLPYMDIMYDSAKARARKWKSARDMLIQQGKNPKVINELDTHNLEILEEEEQLKSFDIDFDISHLPRRYKLNNKDFDALCQFLITVHTLFAGWIIDIHYLIYHDVTPLLPQLLPKFIEDGLEPQIIDTIVLGYQEVYQSFENDRSAWIPELVLDLAHSLSHLPDEYWAREQLNYSLRYWLQLRGRTSMTLSSDWDLDGLLTVISCYLTSQDREYFEMLQKCLAKVGDTEEVIEVDDLLIKIAELEKKADDFYNGGIYHLQNGNYERSIADFEQSQRYRHPDASRMLVEVRKQQNKAILAKQQAEAERQRLEQEKRQQEQKAAEVQLKSDVGMNYSKLRDLLKAGKWKEADEETLRVMLAVTKREKEGRLDIESIENFPCEDLRTIDQLWVKYSKGRFGFSVQKRIYKSLGDTISYDNIIFECFGDRVGWRKGGNWLYEYSDITLDFYSPEGHLPWWGEKWWGYFRSNLYWKLAFLLSRPDL
ncbi:GUN4 domain-containing protein [Dolichospermum circinale]|uniref:GUN4 domain-containing protein n=1 Tax=Dolichospermum circinale TaxID=109265 RepID=UPI002FEE4342